MELFTVTINDGQMFALKTANEVRANILAERAALKHGEQQWSGISVIPGVLIRSHAEFDAMPVDELIPLGLSSVQA